MTESSPAQSHPARTRTLGSHRVHSDGEDSWQDRSHRPRHQTRQGRLADTESHGLVTSDRHKSWHCNVILEAEVRAKVSWIACRRYDSAEASAAIDL